MRDFVPDSSMNPPSHLHNSSPIKKTSHLTSETRETLIQILKQSSSLAEMGNMPPHTNDLHHKAGLVIFVTCVVT